MDVPRRELDLAVKKVVGRVPRKLSPAETESPRPKKPAKPGSRKKKPLLAPRGGGSRAVQKRPSGRKRR